jgi:F5/8 type C domain
MRLRLLLLLLFCGLPVLAQAATVNLAWDAPVPSTGITGYKLYSGSQSGQYGAPINVGNVLTYSVTGVTDNRSTYFAVTATDASGNESAPSNELRVIPGSIPQTSLSVIAVDSEELGSPAYPATQAIDNNMATFWHTVYQTTPPPLPHTLVVDVGSLQTITGFAYLPRQDGYTDGTIGQYAFYVATTFTPCPAGGTWGTAVASGTFASDILEKTVTFAPKAGRYVCLRALSEIGGLPFTSVAELNVFAQTASVPSAPLGLAATLLSSTTARLTWAAPSASVPAVTNYNIYPGYPSGTYTAATTVGNVLTADMPVTPGQAVYFAVTATNSVGPGPPSNEVRVVPGALPQNTLTVAFVDSQETLDFNSPATNAIDNDIMTLWLSQYTPAVIGFPHWIVLDLHATVSVTGFAYLPRQDGAVGGTIGAYQLYVAPTLSTCPGGGSWGTAVSTGTFATNTQEKTVSFTAKSGSFVCLLATSEAFATGPFTSAGELNVFGTTAVPAMTPFIVKRPYGTTGFLLP